MNGTSYKRRFLTGIFSINLITTDIDSFFDAFITLFDHFSYSLSFNVIIIIGLIISTIGFNI